MANKTFCDLLDDYFKALRVHREYLAADSAIVAFDVRKLQDDVDKARIALVKEYEFRAGEHAATRGCVGQWSDLPPVPNPEATQAQIATIMQPVFQVLPFIHGKWHTLSVTIKRNEDNTIGLRSITWDPAA